MTLCWNKAFLTAHRSNSYVNDCLNAFGDLSSLKSSSFPFAMDARSFLCTQIPGMDPSDNFLIDIIQSNPLCKIIVDYISSVRVLLDECKVLREVFETLDMQEFSGMKDDLSRRLNSLTEMHEKRLEAMIIQMKSHPDHCLDDFINFMADYAQILDEHGKYLDGYIQWEAVAKSCSFRQSGPLRAIVGEHTIIELIVAPMTWQQEAVQILKELIASLPDGLERQQEKNVLTQLVRSIVETMEAIDSVPKLEQIAKMFVVEPFPIVVDGRRFVKMGKAKKQCRKGASKREIILFSDMFIYAQPQAGKLLVPAQYDLLHLRVDVREGNHQSLLFYAPKKSFALIFDTPKERDEWRKVCTRTIQSAKDNCLTPIEPQREAPIWIPDSEVMACMDCKTPFTTFNRRHHCRRCGRILCSNCLKKRAIIPEISATKLVKICDACYTSNFGSDQ